MKRKITLRGVEYTADFGGLEMARVTIHGGTVNVSHNLGTRTPGADFEAVFDGTRSIEIFTAPMKTLEDGTVAPDYDIGPLEPGDGETPLALAKTKKLHELAAARYAAEIAGVTVNGATVGTDRESQAMITGAALAATQDTDYTCRWKTENGFVTLTAAQIVAVAMAVRAHVQAQFDREADLANQVAAAETVEAVEAIRWS